MARSARRVQRLVRQSEKTLARQIRQAFVDLQKSISEDRIERAVASRDMFAVYDLVRGLTQRLQQTVPTVTKVFTAGVVMGREQLPKRSRA
jgi:hypothetical protein